MPRRFRRLRCLVTVLVTSAGILAPLAVAPSAVAQAAPRRVISGWLPYWGMPAAYSSSVRHGQLVREAMPFWYGATGVTTIQAQQGAGDRSVVTGLRRQGIRVVPTVTDEAGPKKMAWILSSKTRRAHHRARLVQLVVNNGYDGINLDYESMAWHAQSRRQATALRRGFAALVHGLAYAMHVRHKMLSIAVIAKTRSKTGNAPYVFDYGALGQHVDRFEVMTYDYHWAGGAPGAVAPIGWQAQVMSFTTRFVPARKVELGVPSYGYNWGRRGVTAPAVKFADAMALARSQHAAVQWSAETASPHFSYRAKNGVTHQVWFMNGRAVGARLSLVRRFHLAGIAEWAFGYEDPAQWTSIRHFATTR